MRGLVLSSISARLIPQATKLRFPVIVLNGFGKRPLEPNILKLLSTNDNREVVINADRLDRLKGVRPELIIPLPAPGQPSLPQDALSLAPGQNVRITRAPHIGAMGTLATIRPGMAEFPSGLRAPAARVTLSNGQTVMVPVANLEILE